jgi:hypothetical protein
MIKTIKKAHLYITIISVITIYACNTNKSMSYRTEFNDTSSELRSVIKEFIDSVECNDNFYRVDINNLFYFVKFFEQEDDILFTIKNNYYFTTSEHYNGNLYENDTTNMYYFKVHNRNIVIIDYPKSSGHNLFRKDSYRNTLAMNIKRDNEELTMSGNIPLINPELFRATYRIDSTDGLKLIKLDSTVLVHPYNSESDSFLIIEDEYI